MKFNFKKIVSVFTSTVMLSSTLALAAAANAPAPFVQGGAANAAVVVGSSASADDMGAAAVVKAYLDSKVSTVTSGSNNVEGGVLEDEITLGGGVVTGKIKSALTDSEVPSLADSSFDWDDGSGSDTYNFHEAIVLSNSLVKPITSLDDNDLTGVALSNDKGIEYKYIFDDALNQSAVDDSTSDDADDLYLTILGQNYQVTSMSNSSITVVTSEEKAVKAGDSVTVAGKSVSVDNVFESSVELNGEIISLSGGSKKLANGLRVDVTDIGYHSNAPESSVAIVKIGEDISKTYTTGDEYIGEDEDDPNWVWDISTPGYVNGYIGVKYNQKQTRAKDEIVKVGESYSFPQNYSQVTLVGTTDVSYDDFTVSFDDSTDLWNATQETSTANVADAKVIIIEGPNKDSLTVGGEDTSKVYLRYATNTTGTVQNVVNGSIEFFYEDVNKNYDVTRARYAGQVNLTAPATLASTTIGTIEVGDTTVTIKVAVASGDATLSFVNADGGNTTSLDIGGVALSNTAGTFEWLGGTTETTSKEQAESADVSVNGVNVGTKDNDVMDYYGTIVATPNDNADKDIVEISIPDEQVYAKVSVTGSSSSSEETPVTSGILIVKDNEASAMTGKNLVVVGGSCINTVAATLLGSSTPLCGTAWESATSAGAGSFVINSYAYGGKIATLVAGYNKADTENAAQYLKTHTIDTTAGKKYKGTTATADALVVA